MSAAKLPPVSYMLTYRFGAFGTSGYALTFRPPHAFRVRGIRSRKATSDILPFTKIANPK